MDDGHADTTSPRFKRPEMTRPRSTRQAHPPEGRGRSGRVAAVLVAIVAVIAVVLVSAARLAGSTSSPEPSAGAGATVPVTAVSPSGTGTAPTPFTSAAPTGSPSPAASPTPTSTALAAVPVVPVADYRSTADSIAATDVAAVLSGKSTRWKRLEVVASEADAILDALALTPAMVGTRLVTAPDAATLMGDLAAHRDRLAFMRADAVGPSVRALGWKGDSLFGIHRLKSLADWPLVAQLPAASEPTGATVAAASPAPGTPTTAYDTASTWTMFVGGDIGLDRTVSYVVKDLKKGVDYPYGGGTVKVTGTTCCSAFGWPLPTIVSTGHAGAMRDLISTADLALANMEEPAPDKWTYHPHGTVFTGDPALLAGVARAGFDVVSCASNHIGDGGKLGILQTIAHLKAEGIASFGCGKDLKAARQPATFEVGGAKVAILGYDAIPPAAYWATATTAGSARLTAAAVKADVVAARAAGAQVVIVFPHWGTEYTYGPTAFQREVAHVAIDAGADLVIGNHPHWVQSVEVYKGKPIWYALGNFTFDQSWSEPTLEGISLELTFRGATLVQARMNPHILVKAVQPNLLDVAKDGQRVLGPVYKASGKLLPW
jgi:poly-gamma-glutamate capsule biosynthesis protein CapA/YwtB (metallophosphatase superfamily)